ncbi:hypothetical protein QQF64_031066 [Cirrhinus molitorella]|uniref:Uncharacterized protein n=1 Tax=Cirrhinus molitorella TaxID=172907 RepID=A0ABR3N5I3_9TELE
MRLAILFVFFITLAFSDGLNNVISSDDQPDMLIDPMPCQISQNINKYTTFISKHIILVDFDTTQLNNWGDYLVIMGLCGRSVQSFLHIEDTYKITKICNGQGTRISGDMCISTEKFIVYVVKITEQCKFQIQIENSYVIVACDVIQSVCLPVHYEGQTGTEPSRRGPVCKRQTV